MDAMMEHRIITIFLDHISSKLEGHDAKLSLSIDRISDQIDKESGMLDKIKVWYDVDKTASVNKVIRKSVQRTDTVDICPHCSKEIGEKELFFDHEGKHYGTAGQWYHRCCGKPIEFPENVEEEAEYKE